MTDHAQQRREDICEPAVLIHSALSQQLDIAHTAGKIAGPPDAVWIGWIDLDPSRVRLRVRQRKLRERFGPEIEAGHFVNVLLAEPNDPALRVSLHRIDAGIFG